MLIEIKEQEEEHSGVEQNEIRGAPREIASQQQQFRHVTEHHDELDLKKHGRKRINNRAGTMLTNIIFACVYSDIQYVLVGVRSSISSTTSISACAVRWRSTCSTCT